MALRKGFVRYAFAVQYHGPSFLGFSYQGLQENAILKDGTDLLGIQSVEGRLRDAFTSLLTENGCHFENVQVSSRTDRGVHALYNTCHVDVSLRKDGSVWDSHKLHQALNFHLMRRRRNVGGLLERKRRRKGKGILRESLRNDVCILSVSKAPLFMKNTFFDPQDDNSSSSSSSSSGPEEIDWNVRFSATQRTYLYRILNICHQNQPYGQWALPFEWDRSWRINERKPLCLKAMEEASSYLVGTHDFSSFRTVGCQRHSPIVTIEDIQWLSQPYGHPTDYCWNGGRSDDGGDGGVGAGGLLAVASPPTDATKLLSVKIVGTSFLYRQVRNMVSCLVHVGRGAMPPKQVEQILEAKDRTQCPGMAPAHGLYLVNVQHGDFKI